MPCVVDESKVAAELDFWRGLASSVGSFQRVREGDFTDYCRNFPEIRNQQGIGLDLGCGPWSVFEGQGKDIVAVDPLIGEYQSFACPPGNGVRYGTEIPAQPFDYVWCVNVIDHTPDPKALLTGVRRVLRRGGRFYFGVWFDPALYAPHYKLWNRAVVAAHMGEFKMLRGTEEWWPEHHKYRWWGLYE